MVDNSREDGVQGSCEGDNDNPVRTVQLEGSCWNQEAAVCLMLALPGPGAHSPPDTIAVI